MNISISEVTKQHLDEYINDLGLYEKPLEWED